jgi:hypothetical protein
MSLAAAGGFAQELTTGTMEGAVAREGGAPIEGAVLTIVGPQSARTVVSDSEGRWTAQGLVPGTYEVKVEAAGFATIVQSDVAIYINRRTQLSFVMAAGKVETTIVTAPLLDAKSTGASESLKVADFAPYLPIGRNLTSTFAIAAGVTDGGSIGAANQSIGGASGLDNAYFVDGVNITNSGYGGIGAYSLGFGSLGTGVTYDFLEEVQIKTGGFEADYGQAGGGVVNTVVKTGGKRFAFDVAWYQEFASLSGDPESLIIDPNTVNPTGTQRRDITLSVGGPIVKEKLFFFAAYNPIRWSDGFSLTSGSAGAAYDLDGDGSATDVFAPGETIEGGRTPDEVERYRSIDNYAAKISWFMTPSQRVELSVFGDPSEGDVGPQVPVNYLRALADPIGNPDPSTSATGLEWGGDQATLKYQGVLTPDFFLEAQYAHKENIFQQVGPGTTYRQYFDETTGVNSGGLGFYEDQEDRSDQWSIKFTNVVGPVEVRYGYQREEIEWRQAWHYSGSPYTAYLPDYGEGTVDVDTDGDGIADTTSPFFLNGDGSLSGSYLPVVTATGPGTNVTSAGIYNVTRGSFAPGGNFTGATENNAFVQATWDVRPNVTIKAGLRWTQEMLQGSEGFTLPFSTTPGGLTTAGTSTFEPLTYRFQGELAPRLGASWDVLGNARHKIYGNWGKYYQRVSNDIAFRLFSNEVLLAGEPFDDAELTAPTFNSTCPADPDGDGLYEPVPCHTIASLFGATPGVVADGNNDPDGDGTNNAATRLPYIKEWMLGYAWGLTDYSVLEFRYIDRSLGRVLEDTQFASAEQIENLFNGPAGNPQVLADPFPGHGIRSYGPGTLANVGENVPGTLFPKPVRDYQAFEAIYNRRFHENWLVYANYRLARLNGNYEGGYRNDNGQSDPSYTSLFDFPATSGVDTDSDGVTDTYLTSEVMAGQYITGPLNTDRRHILNLFLSRRFDAGFNVGGRLTVRSGQPNFPLFAHPVYLNPGEIPGIDPTYWLLVDADTDGDLVSDGLGVFRTGDPTTPYPAGDTSTDFNGDGVNDTVVGTAYSGGPQLFSSDPVERDFLGRTPTTTTLDLHGSYEWKAGKGLFTAILDVFNVFNEQEVFAFDKNVETAPGSPNANFQRPNSYQTPRALRFGLRFGW